MLEKPKYIIIFIVSCYCFSLGIFTARAVEIVQERQKVLSKIETLNEIQGEKVTQLQKLQELMKDKEEFSSVSKHLNAIEQLSTPFKEAELIMQIEKNKELRSFYINFIKQLAKYSSKESFFTEILLLESIELKMIDQQNEMTQLLINQAD